MSRRGRQRLDDRQAALDTIEDHLARGDLSDGLVSDAVRVRLIEIGEAVKGLSADLLATEPDLPWAGQYERSFELVRFGRVDLDPG